MKTFYRTALIGIGATATVDVFTYVLSMLTHKGHGILYIGRWIAYAFKGTFFHDSIIQTPSTNNELLIGWIAHYAVGILFAFTLILLFGNKWPNKPNFLAAMIVGNITLLFPIGILHPAMGFGVAFTKLPHTGFLLTKIILIHAVYGLGLYLTAITMKRFAVSY